MARKKAAVIGATGVAGQQFLAALSDHPWFEVTALAASERSAGKAYKDAITDPNGASRWYCQEPLDSAFGINYASWLRPVWAVLMLVGVVLALASRSLRASSPAPTA